MAESEYTPRDLAVYLVVFSAFYILFQSAPSRWAELLTAQTSSSVMNLAGLESSYGVEYGIVYLDLASGLRNVHVYVIRECSAIHVLGVILGLVVPLRGASLRRKAGAAVFGGFMIYALNILRVVLTVVLTGYDLPPFSWFFTSPTVETYHYPISFLFGVFGIAVTVLSMDRVFVPKLGDFLGSVPDVLRGFLGFNRVSSTIVEPRVDEDR